METPFVAAVIHVAGSTGRPDGVVTLSIWEATDLTRPYASLAGDAVG